MVKLSRREFLATTSALVLSRSAVAGAPGRLARKDCYFGLHFDLHPTEADKDLGRDLTEEMVNNLLEKCRPDFIQYDSKGHPGYLGFPSKTGMSAPGIVQDSLAIWRRATAAHGVALYNHFSGVLDGLAVARHPEWASVGADGNRGPQETSLFGEYEQVLMIPELLEVALKYDLDGSWVDGDCWAVNPDYCAAAQRKFLEKTGIDALPRKPEDKGWNEFLEMQREEFRQYVARYVDAVHRAKPGYQITSSRMYSTYMPERPSVQVDFLSGDVADWTAVRQARMDSRYLSRCGKPWDLMSWGFERTRHLGLYSTKPAVEVEQEAAVVLAQGGGFQIYYVPSRAGWIDERIVKEAAEVGRFCRERQRWSHGSESLPEVGVLFSGGTLYRTTGRVFGSWGNAEAPAAGAIDLLLGCGYSVDLIPDWQAAECAARYPLIVVPDWQDVGDEVANTLGRYVSGGGKLVVCGAENARLFSGIFNLRVADQAANHTYLIADDSGFADVTGSWAEVEAPVLEIVAFAYRTADTRKDMLPLAIRRDHGKGSVLVCPGPIFSTYGNDSTPIIGSVMRRLLAPLHAPMVSLEGDYANLEIVLRKKDNQTLVHLINSAEAPVTGEFRHTGVVPRTGPIHLRMRLPAAPASVVLEPEGTSLSGKYEAGEWSGIVPDLHVHSIIRVSGEAALAGCLRASSEMA